MNMKKILFLISIFMMFCTVSGNAGDLEKWSIVNKNDVIEYQGLKIGNYYFDIVKKTLEGKTKSILMYSVNGINFEEVRGISIAVYPKYDNGLYFIIDTTLATVPPNKQRYSSVTNNPAYVLDENLNVINIFEQSGFYKYLGYQKGFFYIDRSGYVFDEEIGDMQRVGFVYKSADGIEWEFVDNDINSRYLSKGKKLYNDEIYYKEYESSTRKDVESLIIDNKEIKIAREDSEFLGIWTSDLTNKLYQISTVVGEQTVDWIDGRKAKESIVKEYLTLDCLYGVEMPQDIGEYKFEQDGKFYFEKDDTSYYCITRSELINKPKVVYNDKVLAFETAPIIENDRTLVPMRFLFEQMGAEVSWDGETQTATVEKEDDIISFSIDNTEALINDTVKTMDVPARLVNDKTMIPLRFLSEELGYVVEWDGETRTVTIK